MTRYETFEQPSPQAGKAKQSGLRIIDGGAAAQAERVPMPPPGLLAHAPQELAADMATLFVMGLVRDLPLSALADPHAEIVLDHGVRFTLSELLCELRSLPWFDAETPEEDWRQLDDAAHARRRAALDPTGQLTLASLFRCGVSQSCSGKASGLLAADRKIGTPEGPCDAPAETAPLSDFVLWAGRHAGAGLGLPGLTPQQPAARSLHALADQIEATPIGRVYYNAAFDALARGVRFDSGMPVGGASWSAGRLFALMAEAEKRARAMSLTLAADRDRLSRPAVTAARLSVTLSREDVDDPVDARALAAAAGLLERFAPRLMHWMTCAHRNPRRPLSMSHALFLPLLGPNEHPPHPADLAPAVLTAGALATVMKAVFNTTTRHVACAAMHRAHDGSLGAELDLLASQCGLARAVKATHYPAENHRELRLGQAIALGLLRDRLEADNRAAALHLRDFDGATLRLRATQRRFGRAHVSLTRDGVSVPFCPEMGGRASPVLTAVV
ncbi:hypothetical protein [Cognatishimia sp. F0-27]|uniref:hypothetical protein n=1 Tax=Cognatishimia sp. F0-27 TaxID=2816855 RepID=UPI001D0C27DF|nr:hypothetical protein [Cognatishimia sp. F0-27]MCC1493816.1 hypothetical protein [Cognatishimia sp. F0-27]